MTTTRPSKRPRLTGSRLVTSLPPPLPLPSSSCPILDSGVTSNILSFLDGDSFCNAAAVSRGFRHAIIPRQKNVCIRGFHSYKSMKQINFTGATYFSGRDSPLVTNEVLNDLAECFPKLTSVDLSGCENINLNGIRKLVKSLGPRLHRFTMIRSRFSERKSDQRMTPAIIKLLSTSCSNIQTLKLILPTKCAGSSLQTLNGKPTLRTLSLMFSGTKPTLLPRNLSQLQHLSLWTDFDSGFEWTELENVEYPNLKSLVITDCQLADSPCPNNSRLSAEALITIMSKSPCTQSLTIRLISPWSKLHREKTNQEARLQSYLAARDIQYTGPSLDSWRYY